MPLTRFMTPLSVQVDGSPLVPCSVEDYRNDRIIYLVRFDDGFHTWRFRDELFPIAAIPATNNQQPTTPVLP